MASAGQRLGPQQGDVAGDDDQVVLEVGVVGEGGEGDADRVAGAALDGLLDELDRHVADELLLERLGDVLGGVADDDHDPLQREQLERVEHVQEHGPSAERVEHFGRGRPHAGAFTRRQHHQRSPVGSPSAMISSVRGCSGAGSRTPTWDAKGPRAAVTPPPKSSSRRYLMCGSRPCPTSLRPAMGSLIKKRRKRMRKKKHKKLLKKTRWQRRQQGR